MSVYDNEDALIDLCAKYLYIFMRLDKLNACRVLHCRNYHTRVRRYA